MAQKDSRLIATASFVTSVRGTEYTVVAGTTIISGAHPLAKSHPQSFREVGPSPDVEAATDAPGEKRGKKGE